MTDAPLPNDLYFARDVRELDRLAIEEYHIPAFTLMRRAGEAAFAALRERWPWARRLVVLCGGGNNGGDGYVIARLALEAGFEVQVHHFSDPTGLRGSAREAWQEARAAGVAMQPFETSMAQRTMEGDGWAVVDAMLGTGLNGEVRGAIRETIGAVNRSGAPVLAVDIPSGLDSDTGEELGEAVRAALTVTFIGLKAGQFRARGPVCCGELRYASLGVPPEIFRRVKPAASRG